MRSRGLSSTDIRNLQAILEAHRADGGRLSEKPTVTKSNEAWCDECNSRITHTISYGEVGHTDSCERRETEYTGRRGRRQSPPTATEVASD